MEMKIPAIAITAVVVVIVLAGVLMPVLDYATATEDTFTNQGYFYLENPTDSITLTLADGVLQVNGESVNPPSSTAYPDGISILVTENAIFRYYGSELRSRGGLIGYHSFDVCELTFASGTVTGTYTETGGSTATTVNKTYTDLTVITPNSSDLVMCKSVGQYVHEDSTIRGAGVIATPTQSTKYWVCEWEGSIADGINVYLYGQSTGTAPESTMATNIQINYEKVDSHEDLYKISSVTFDVVGAVEGSDAVTFTNYMTPAEVTSERVIHFSDNESAIFVAIPIMVIVALLIAVVALVFRGRNF